MTDDRTDTHGPGLDALESLDEMRSLIFEGMGANTAILTAAEQAGDPEAIAAAQARDEHLRKLLEMIHALKNDERADREHAALAAAERLTAASVRAARSTMWASWAMVVVAIAAVVVALL